MNTFPSPNEQNKLYLEKLHRLNWEEVLNIQLEEAQTKFVPPVLYSVAQSAFEKNAELFAIKLGNKTFGFLMLLVNPPEIWIARILIDKKYQRLGFGSEVVRKIISQYAPKRRFRTLKASVDKQNKPAQQFFHSLGFEPVAVIDKEIIFEYLL